jgi:hypothetical protein
MQLLQRTPRLRPQTLLKQKGHCSARDVPEQGCAVLHRPVGIQSISFFVCAPTEMRVTEVE